VKLTEQKIYASQELDLRKIRSKCVVKKKQNDSATRIQKWWRVVKPSSDGNFCFFKSIFKVRAILRIQRWWIQINLKQKWLKKYQTKMSAASTVQRYLRRYREFLKDRQLKKMYETFDFFEKWRDKIRQQELTSSQVLIQYHWRKHHTAL
jgi:hypothetical protein